MSPLGHVLTLAVVGTFSTVCTAIGLACLRYSSRPQLRPLLMLPLAVLLGSGLLAAALLALSAAGWLQRWILAGILPLIALALRREVAEALRLVRSASRELAAIVPVPLVGLFAAITLLQLAVTLAPPVDYDSLMYHVDVPAEFLRSGNIHLPPDNLHVAQVGLVHMLYLPLIAFGGYAAPAVLELAFAVLVALVVAALLDDLAGRDAAALGFATIWGTLAFTLSAETPKIDAALVLYLLVGQALLLPAGKAWKRRTACALAGLVVGCGAGVKLHGGLYALALVPLAYGVGLHETGAGHRIRNALIFSIAVLAGALPWLLKNWVLLGAPFYPLLSPALPPPWLQQAYGSVGPLEPSAVTALVRARAPVNLLDVVFAPGRLTPEAEGRMYLLNPLTLAAPFALVALRDRGTLAFVLSPLMYLAGLLVYRRHQNLRYLIPALVPLAGLGAAVVGVAVRRFASSPRRSGGLVLIGGLALIPTLLVLARSLSIRDAPGFLLRSQPVTEYLTQVGDYGIRSHIQIVNRVNTSLDSSSRVLMLFEGRGLYFNVPVLQDNVLRNWPFVVASGAGQDCLERSGVTHVLVGESTLRYFADRGLDPDDLKWGDFAAFRERCLDSVFTNGDYTLYRVVARDR